MKDSLSDLPPSMITPEGNIIVSDHEIDELFNRPVTPEEGAAAEKRMDEFARELRRRFPDRYPEDATPPSDKQDPEKPA